MIYGKVNKLIGIDLAKRCYQVCAVDEHYKVLYNRKYTAKKFAEEIAQLDPTTVAMEACAAAHYWGRRLQAAGHRVLLVPPQHAKAFRRGHKSDEHDALSIVEAAQRPNIHFVPVKTITQQDLQMLGGLRGQCVAQRTALINQARGFAREYGVNFPAARTAFMRELPSALESADNDLMPIARASEDLAHQRLQTIPGVGPCSLPSCWPSCGMPSNSGPAATAQRGSAWSQNR